MTVLKKLYGTLTKFEELVCSIAFLFLVVVIVGDIIIRKFTGSSIPWLEESSRMIFMAITLVTASVAVSTDEHPRMNALQITLGVKRGNYMILATDLLCMCFFGFMLCFAMQSTINMYTFGTSYTSIPFKLWQVYIFFPLSFAGITLRHLVRVIVGVRKICRHEDIERGEEQ